MHHIRQCLSDRLCCMRVSLQTRTTREDKYQTKPCPASTPTHLSYPSHAHNLHNHIFTTQEKSGKLVKRVPPNRLITLVLVPLPILRKGDDREDRVMTHETESVHFMSENWDSRQGSYEGGPYARSVRLCHRGVLVFVGSFIDPLDVHVLSTHLSPLLMNHTRTPRDCSFSPF